jgi:hypothetical protein
MLHRKTVLVQWFASTSPPLPRPHPCASAGIVIGVLAAVALLAGGVWALRRRSARRSGFSAYDTSKGAIGKDFSAPV